MLLSEAGLTDEQRRIVEWGDGPLVVIAGAGTGKTRVIVERVRWLLETLGAATVAPDGSLRCAYPSPDAPVSEPFAGPLLPEQILVLTYNVKAARELGERIEKAVGPGTRARLAIGNFHSFCHRVLTDSAADAGLPTRPDVLDGVGQLLLLRDLRPDLPLRYYSGRGALDYWLGALVGFINRAKDELVTPAEVAAFAERERAAFEQRFGSFDRAIERVSALGDLEPLRKVRPAYAELRRAERAAETGEAGGEDHAPDIEAVEKAADREARRTLWGDGRAHGRTEFDPADHPRIEALAASYVEDAATLEVMRMGELAVVYQAYQDELARRGAIDFGEQISLVTQLFKRKPNVLRRYQRTFRHLLVDEFQDANIAQIELIELLGRTPDRPDNVMVVGDDDQSIYRFRGASYAAFVEFDRRFGGPPAHDPGARPPGPPARLRLEDNFRSLEPVLTVANRLITRNALRYEPDKVLRPTRGSGAPVELVVATDLEDEARQVVDRIKALAGWEPGDPASGEPDWRRFAVLYRKHRHREAIVARLRDEGIPYTVVGGLSLFETPEIRDLEQSLRAIVDPHLDAALVRMMSAAPWRLDALEILQITRTAAYARRHLVDAIHEVVESGELEVDEAVDPAEAGSAPTVPVPSRGTRRTPLRSTTRAKLRRLLATLDDLAARTWREGPFTVLDEYVAHTGLVFDLLSIDSLDAKRTIANIGSFMRFAQDWQAEHPRGCLGDFVAYLDAYQAAGGELPTSVEASEDVVGVQLMTLYQAKGLEFDHVFVPQLLKDEWPARESGSGLFPRELLKEAVPAGDIHTEEERRLLYVALTRSRERLTITTIAGPAAEKDPSPFLTDLQEGAGTELIVIDRVAEAREAAVALGVVAPVDDAEAQGESSVLPASLPVPRAMPAPTIRERRLAVRSRATELLQLLEGIDPAEPEAVEARARLTAEFAALAGRAIETADEARERRLDPLTMRVVALDSEAGASLLDIAPLPGTFSYSQVDTYQRCPLQYALQKVYRIPSGRKAGALTFGSTAHTAFETFTRERRERLARGEPPPTRVDLERWFQAEWKGGEFEGQATEEHYRGRIGPLLDAFWQGELSAVGTVVAEEVPFELRIGVPSGGPAIFTGSIDRVDRLPSGGVEILDYKTGRVSSQKSVEESLQLSIYALASRDALGFGTPERVTLYFTETGTRMSTTRTDEQLDAARDLLADWVTRVRTGDFAATPSGGTCRWCDYQALCPERMR